MKGWQVALLCLAVAALAVAGTLLFTRPDIPGYTADQVIAVAKAYAGEECGGSSRFASPPGAKPPEPSWTTVYLGDGKWRVTKKCWSVEEWTFYEATGELR